MKPKITDLLKQLEDPETIKQLRDAGVVIKKDVKYVRKTFEVSEPVLRDFMETAHSRSLKIKDAIHQALTEWIKRNT